MNDKENIRAEIKRLKDELINGVNKSEIDMGRISAFEDILLYIDSLPEESVSDDLEEAASDCYYHNHAYAKESFIEGAKWQKENDILIFKQVYADLLSAKGYNIGFVNSEIDRLEKELNMED